MANSISHPTLDAKHDQVQRYAQLSSAKFLKKRFRWLSTCLTQRGHIQFVNLRLSEKAWTRARDAKSLAMWVEFH